MSDATLFQIKPYRWRFTETPYNFPSKQKRLRNFHIPEPLVLLRQNYYGLGGGVGLLCFLFSAFRLPVALAVIR